MMYCYEPSRVVSIVRFIHTCIVMAVLERMELVVGLGANPCKDAVGALGLLYPRDGRGEIPGINRRGGMEELNAVR